MILNEKMQTICLSVVSAIYKYSVNYSIK